MKIELIKFGKDKYAVRRTKWWGGYEYLDLDARAVNYWWRVDSEYSRCCMGLRKNAEEAFNNISRLKKDYSPLILRSRKI